MRWRRLGVGAAVLAVGGGVGGYGMYQRRLRDNRSVTPSEFHAAQGEAFTTLVNGDKAALMRRAQPALLLYRFQTCPYCGTVKALLDLCSVPHTVVEVDPMLKTQIKPHGYGRVPQLKFPDGTLLVDSEEIINILAPKLGLMSDPAQEHWRSWARDQLSRYIVLVLNQSLGDAMRAYSYIDPIKEVPLWSKWLLKAVGGPVMFLVARYRTKPTLEKQYGLGTRDPKAVMAEQLQEWVRSHPQGQPFHGGQQPDLADLDVYGILHSTRHRPLWHEVQADGPTKAWVDHMDTLLTRNRREVAGVKTPSEPL